MMLFEWFTKKSFQHNLQPDNFSEENAQQNNQPFSRSSKRLLEHEPAIFLRLFQPTPPHFTAAQAWSNFMQVQDSVKHWRHLVTQETLSAWFALTLNDPAHTYLVLRFVYRHFRKTLLDSQLLVGTLGLDGATRDNSAKLALKQMVAHRSTEDQWRIFLNLHGDLVSPLYENNLDGLQSFIDSLSRDNVISFWIKHHPHLPRYAGLLLANKIVAIQSVDVLVQHLAFLAPANLHQQQQQTNAWSRVQQDVINLWQSKVKLPQCVHDSLRTVLAQPILAKQIGLADLDRELFLSYMCDPSRVQLWDETLANHPHLAQLLQDSDRFKAILPAYFPFVAAKGSMTL